MTITHPPPSAPDIPHAADKIFASDSPKGWTGVSVIALNHTYRPPSCDHPHKGSAARALCVHAPAGLQADSFLYALSPVVYVTAFPIFLSDNRSSAVSTLHQSDVVRKHLQAFRIMHEQVRELYLTKDPLPVYVDKACELDN